MRLSVCVCVGASVSHLSLPVRQLPSAVEFPQQLLFPVVPPRIPLDHLSLTTHGNQTRLLMRSLCGLSRQCLLVTLSQLLLLLVTLSQLLLLLRGAQSEVLRRVAWAVGEGGRQPALYCSPPPKTRTGTRRGRRERCERGGRG